MIVIAQARALLEPHAKGGIPDDSRVRVVLSALVEQLEAALEANKTQRDQWTAAVRVVCLVDNEDGSPASRYEYSPQIKELAKRMEVYLP